VKSDDCEKHRAERAIINFLDRDINLSQFLAVSGTSAAPKCSKRRTTIFQFITPYMNCTERKCFTRKNVVCMKVKDQEFSVTRTEAENKALHLLG
jgi:hypothetical protein